MTNRLLHTTQSHLASVFEWDSRRAWRPNELEVRLNELRSELQLGSVTTSTLLEYLVTHTPLTKVTLPFLQPLTCFYWHPCSAFEVAMILRSKSYLSHAGAMYLNGLLPCAPEPIYSNAEQPGTGKTGSDLDQEGIDRAFGKPPRTSNSHAGFGGVEIYQISGKNTGYLGVIEADHPRYGHLRFTDLERTLIDIVVRPCYSGGPRAVLEAYSAAKSRLSLERLASTLEELDLTYPYHQAIGFYLERSGWSLDDLRLFRDQPMEFDFYLDYAMDGPAYSPDWRLYYPEDLDL